MSILQMKKLRHGEAQSFPQSLNGPAIEPVLK